MIARQVVVHGMVQGVGFRVSLVAEARGLGLVGWVRNRVDGGVEAHVEGDADAVDALVAWARQGPRFAAVSRVEVREVDVEGCVGFTVEY